MRHSDHDSSKGIQIVLQNGQCGNINIICDLVKKQDIWRCCKHFQKVQALLLSSGKLFYWRILHGRIKQKLLQKLCCTDQSVLCGNILCNILNIINYPLTGVHFLNFLRKITDLYGFSNLYRPAVRLYDTCNNFKKRRFATAVGSDDSQPLIFQHNVVKIPDAYLISKAFGNMMKLNCFFAHSCLYRINLHVFVADRRSAVFQCFQTVKPCSLLGSPCTTASFCPFQLHSENTLAFPL